MDEFPKFSYVAGLRQEALMILGWEFIEQLCSGQSGHDSQ